VGETWPLGLASSGLPPPSLSPHSRASLGAATGAAACAPHLLTSSWGNRHVTRADYGTFRLVPRSQGGTGGRSLLGHDHLVRIWLLMSQLSRHTAGPRLAPPPSLLSHPSAPLSPRRLECCHRRCAAPPITRLCTPLASRRGADFHLVGAVLDLLDRQSSASGRA